jgi:hypothetical protein
MKESGVFLAARCPIAVDLSSAWFREPQNVYLVLAQTDTGLQWLNPYQVCIYLLR